MGQAVSVWIAIFELWLLYFFSFDQKSIKRKKAKNKNNQNKTKQNKTKKKNKPKTKQKKKTNKRKKLGDGDHCFLHFLKKFTQSVTVEDGILLPVQASAITVTMVVYVMMRLGSVYVDLDSWELIV